MRIIFILLVIANLIYLFYNLNKAPDEIEIKGHSFENEIVLYSESTKDHNLPLELPSDSQEDKNKIENIVKEEAVRSGLSVFEESMESTNSGLEDQNIEKLFTEVESQSKTIINNEELVKKSTPIAKYELKHKKTAKKKTLNCYVLGPTQHQKKLAALKKKINQMFGTEDFYSFKQKGTTYYRIFIPPLSNNQEISKAIKKLDEIKLYDHYVMSIDGKKMP